MGATFLVCHGAWSAGWARKKMHPLMAAAGHRLVTPTYTGVGELVHNRLGEKMVWSPFE